MKTPPTKKVRSEELISRVEEFLQNHRTELSVVSGQITNLFETFCFVLVAKHYERIGFEVKPQKLLDGKFLFKYSTRGNPWNYSYFIMTKQAVSDSQNTISYELRHNLKVASAWTDNSPDEDSNALLAVDIGVVRCGQIPDPPRGTPHNGQPTWASNSDLFTFGEVKKLVAYPMLLAQFVGTVHELKPEYMGIENPALSGTKRDKNDHPYPLLMTDGRLTRGSVKVLESFRQRGYRLIVVPNVASWQEESVLNGLRNDEVDLSLIDW